jgi:NAD(P)-dependent dehydrogenase (short-subunit alcohol dehydrogenase family)
MGRFAFPDDVAKAVAFLADPEQSGFVNGATLTVDGGGPATGAGRACVTGTGRADPAWPS